jgi:hypothetical protein
VGRKIIFKVQANTQQTRGPVVEREVLVGN